MATDIINSLRFNGESGDVHVFTIPYGACATAADTAAKAVTVDNFALLAQASVRVKFSNANTAANPTLNVNNTGAKAIYYKGAAITASYLEAKTYDFVYNGTQWELVGDVGEITGGASTIETSNLTASRALVSNASGKVAVSAVTSTELGYLDGVTSNVQTQLNDKVSKNSTGVQTMTGGLNLGGTPTAGTGVGRLMITGNTNPLIGLQAIDANGNKLSPYYFQVSNNIMYLGPTSAKALSFDSDGNVTLPATMSVTGAISEGGTTLSDKYAAKSHTHDDRYYTETEIDTKVYTLNTSISGKAPTAHASTATTYGIGTSSNYGHVKLSDSTSSTSGASAGIAASPAAVKAAYDLANGKANASHTHNYAGSSSAGGSATSAVKLDTATAGSATQPVYFSGGKPVKTTYTLGKSVPSNAVFTDDSVTSVDNHYTPVTSDWFNITATPDDPSELSIYYVKDITLSKDSKGHVTNLTCAEGAFTPQIVVNGLANFLSNSVPSFYAPNTLGTSKQILTGSDMNEPMWASPQDVIDVATTSVSGLMSASDKDKMDSTNIAYATCNTAAATAEKVVTISGNDNWSLSIGSVITVKFTYTNTAASPTLNVNGTGAKPIYYNNAVYTSSSSYGGYANRHIVYQYDGTNWVFISWGYDTNSDTKVQQNAAITTAGEYPVILAYSTSTAKVTNAVQKTSTLKYNPSTQILTAPTFKGALDGNAATASKLGTSTVGGAGTPIYLNAGVATACTGVAALASPTFTGTPKAPTAAAGTNTTQIATTAFVTAAISTAVDGAIASSY